MKKIITKLLLSSVFASAVVFAQPGGPGTPPSPADFVQRRVDHLTAALGLSAAQQQQAATIFTNAVTASAATRDSMTAANQALAAAVKNNDTTGIDLASTTIGNLTTQSTALNAKAEAAFYKILTADQQTKYSALRGPGGPGGFGGRGGPGGRH